MARPRSQTADEVADIRVQAAMAPILAAIEAQQQAEQRRALEQQQALQGYSLAAADLLKGIGPQVQQGYQQAAGAQSAFAKGFSIGFQQEMGKSAGDANALLAQQGSPQQVASQGTAGADVLYGLGGFIPASTLNREGAAFGAAASMLPATQAGLGQQSIYQARQESAERQRALSDKLLEVEAQRPGLLQKAKAEIWERNQARQAAKAKAAQDERDFRLKLRAQNLNEQLAVANLGLKQSDLKLRQQATKVRLTNERLRIQLDKLKSDRNFQLGLDRLGIQDANLRLRAAELEARLRSQAKKGGFTAKQRLDLQKDAAAFAREAYHGWTGDDGVYHPPTPYQTAILDMLNEGIPLAVAQRALNRYWQRPGQLQEWEKPGQGRPFVKFQARQKKKPKPTGR